MSIRKCKCCFPALSFFNDRSDGSPNTKKANLGASDSLVAINRDILDGRFVQCEINATHNMRDGEIYLCVCQAIDFVSYSDIPEVML